MLMPDDGFRFIQRLFTMPLIHHAILSIDDITPLLPCLFRGHASRRLSLMSRLALKAVTTITPRLSVYDDQLVAEITL